MKEILIVGSFFDSVSPATHAPKNNRDDVTLDNAIEGVVAIDFGDP